MKKNTIPTNPKYMMLSNEFEEDSAIDKQSIITLSTENFNNNPVGNKIYLYDEISRSSILNISKQIDIVTQQLKMLQLVYNMSTPIPIELHISSDGGDISPALSLVDKIISNSIPVHTYCEGMCASAATLISVSGHKRFITKNSHILMHQLSSGVWGKFEQINDEKQNLDLFMQVIKNIYLQHTKIKSKELTELLKHDFCLPAIKCKELGIVDEII
jgi:ATP-dependent protease ClpP protease subunit